MVVDQKGHHHRKEVSLNVRTRQVIDPEEVEQDQKVVNYITEKSRRLISDERLPSDLREEMEKLTDQYESAIRTDEDDRSIDLCEDRLLEQIEKAEERLKPVE